jgi:hypothetical protein
MKAEQEELAKQAEADKTCSEILKTHEAQAKKDKKALIEERVQAKLVERREAKLKARTVKPVIILSREEKDKQIAEQKVRKAEQLKAEQEARLAKLQIETDKKGLTINTGKKAKGNHAQGSKSRNERKNFLDDYEYFANKNDEFIDNTLA